MGLEKPYDLDELTAAVFGKNIAAKIYRSQAMKRDETHKDDNGMMDVFFYEAFEEEATQLKRWLPPGIRADFDARAAGETDHAEPPARVISIRTQSVVPLAWADRIGGILTRSTGYDHVTRWLAACGRAIPAGYLPLYCHRAVAEQALTLWMALWRKLARQTAQFDRFCRDGLTGTECEGKTLLVVGVGAIGHAVTRIGAGLDMTVLGVDIEPRHKDVTYVGIADGLARADAIVCAMSLNAGNVGYFDRARWRATKPGAIFVNIARGELAPVAELLWALDNGILAGAALDVYDDEPALAAAMRAGRESDLPGWKEWRAFRRRPDTICTPHNAFNTAEAVERKSRQSVEQIETFLKTGRFPWPVPLGQG